MYKRGLAAKSWNSTPSSTLAAEAAAVIFPRPLPQRQTIKLIGKVFYDLSGGAVWGPHMVGAIVVVVFGLTHLFGREALYTHTVWWIWIYEKGRQMVILPHLEEQDQSSERFLKWGARLLCGIFIPYAMLRIQFGYCSSACFDSFCQNWGHCTPSTTKDWISWWP